MVPYSIHVSNLKKNFPIFRSNLHRIKYALSRKVRSSTKFHPSLKGVSLNVKPGEKLGIVGANGAGKSTLLKIICGVSVPSEGSVETFGKIGSIIELTGGINEYSTGRENFNFFAAINSIYGEARKDLCRQVEEWTELGSFFDMPVKSYSSGMKSRLAFALNTLTCPDILILDEVLAVGDVFFRKKCFDKVEELVKGGTSVLFVSHSLNLIVALCDRAVLLDQGEIILDSAPSEVTRQFERLIFAPKSMKAKVRSEILGTSDAGTEAGTMLDTGLIASPEAHYKDYHDLEFDRAWIEDLKGNILNILESGGTYTLRVELCANSIVNDAIFDVAVRDIRGVKLTTITTIGKPGPINVKSGEKVSLAMHFKNVFFSGEFFVNLAIFNNIGKSDFLQKISNITVFKAYGSGQRGISGMIDLEQSVELEVALRTP